MSTEERTRKNLPGRRIVLAASVIAAAVAAFVVFARDGRPDDVSTGPTASLIPSALDRSLRVIESLPPTAAGPADASAARQSSSANPRSAQESLGGTTATGRVDAVAVRVAEGVLIDLGSALPSQRGGQRYVTLDFPAPLANGATQFRALVPEGDGGIDIGDVVEMRFAHRKIRIPFAEDLFPVIEKDRVTTVVAKAGTPLAMDYQRRILARNGSGPGADRPPATARWDALPLDKAVKIVRGKGSREMAIFSDPNCPACRTFENTLQQVDDLTVYVFMVPVIRPERAEDSKNIWCASDRARAWQDLTLRQQAPQAKDCDNPVQSVVALGDSLGLRATPTVVFRNGVRVQGALSTGTLLARLDQATDDLQKAKPR
jgi:hypothetical protein